MKSSGDNYTHLTQHTHQQGHIRRGGGGGAFSIDHAPLSDTICHNYVACAHMQCWKHYSYRENEPLLVKTQLQLKMFWGRSPRPAFNPLLSFSPVSAPGMHTHHTHTTHTTHIPHTPHTHTHTHTHTRHTHYSPGFLIAFFC